MRTISRSSYTNYVNNIRMNQDIQLLANELFYHGRMKCANEQIRDSKIQLVTRLDDCEHLKKILTSSVAWINTKGIKYFDQRIGDSYCNRAEARIVVSSSQLARQGTG